MKVTINYTIDVNPEQWDFEFGILDQDDSAMYSQDTGLPTRRGEDVIAKDVKVYFESTIEGQLERLGLGLGS